MTTVVDITLTDTSVASAVCAVANSCTCTKCTAQKEKDVTVSTTVHDTFFVLNFSYFPCNEIHAIMVARLFEINSTFEWEPITNVTIDLGTGTPYDTTTVRVHCTMQRMHRPSLVERMLSIDPTDEAKLLSYRQRRSDTIPSINPVLIDFNHVGVVNGSIVSADRLAIEMSLSRLNGIQPGVQLSFTVSVYRDHYAVEAVGYVGVIRDVIFDALVRPLNEGRQYIDENNDADAHEDLACNQVIDAYYRLVHSDDGPHHCLCVVVRKTALTRIRASTPTRARNVMSFGGARTSTNVPKNMIQSNTLRDARYDETPDDTSNNNNLRSTTNCRKMSRIRYPRRRRFQPIGEHERRKKRIHANIEIRTTAAINEMNVVPDHPANMQTAPVPVPVPVPVMALAPAPATVPATSLTKT